MIDESLPPPRQGRESDDPVEISRRIMARYAKRQEKVVQTESPLPPSFDELPPVDATNDSSSTESSASLEAATLPPPLGEPHPQAEFDFEERKEA